ncbi:deoxyribodipyrimidine photo-lyase-like [Spea bombifrons]|uniref:deoxyribodipyrimidine photo-lyase-like n=1 Tax=Spea bombifrons TaxID=233779 RepID=UPI00234B558A|nr:deoxyribodipyrimidine photo-lyase-like [Spea bombifrons]
MDGPVSPSLSQMEGLLQGLLAGSIEADEFFCMVLSLLGSHRTRSQFPGIVGRLRKQEPTLYAQLIHMHADYFHQVSPDSEVLDHDIDLELAIALSLQEDSSTAQPTESSPAFQELQRQSGDAKISFAEAARGSSSQSHKDPTPSRFNKDVKTKDNQTMKELPQTLQRLQAVEQKTNVGISYNGQPEPEDCVLNTDGGDLFSLEPSDPKQSKPKKSRRNRRKKSSDPLKSPVCMRPVLVWFRRDLRLYDNPALMAALELGVPVIPVFLWCLTEETGQNFTLATGGATKYWLHHALSQLNQSLGHKFGSHIVFRVTQSCARELTSLVQETGADTVVVNTVYEPWLKERDDIIAETLKKQRVKFKRFHSYCLYEPYSVSTEGVGLRGIGSVTHFMSCCKRNTSGPLGTPLEAPTSLPIPSRWPESSDLSRLNLSRMPRRKDGTVVDWAATIRATWDFSEDGAFRCLTNFLEHGVRHYEKESGRTDEPYTSHISPYLHFGQISPRTILHEAYFTKKNVPKFLRKLAWRDLAYWLLVLFPDMPTEPIRPAYKSQRWSGDQDHLRVWQKGMTGYPLVDAAMRELWLTGWMNNYARHVVASFLVAYLHIHWVHGYRWFQDTLVDADVAINAMMWQNGGMSGLDHWNFVMHPVDAALTCDPYGSYVRKWCPELAGLPDEYIHKPWKCAPSQLRRTGVTLGETYPHRIVVDLEERREQSLRDVVDVRMRHSAYIDDISGCDMVPIPDHLLALTLGQSEGEDDVIKSQKGRFLLPVITRKEFKYKTLQPHAKDNPFNTVLKGYVSRKRDETIAYMNERHFTASTISEATQMHERRERTSRLLEGLPQPKDPKNKSRRTPRNDPYTVVPPGFFHLAN